MTVEAYPLQWPAGRPRTERWNRETAKFDVTFARARDDLMKEVQLLCGGKWGPEPHLVISTNVSLRRDGLPLAGQRAPDDVGVAVYFTRRKKQMSFACDRWLKVEHNMRAIAKTIEALRGIERWGTGDMVEAAFTGFTALPAPASEGSPRSWWQVLLVSQHATATEILTAYRNLRSTYHPDKPGGNAARFDEVQKAYEQAGAEGRA